MGCLICVLFLGAVVLVVIKVYIKLTTGWCRSNVCLVGRTVIVTGANTGIGYQTAEDFAKRGAKVILACRDPNRGQDATGRIIEATGNRNVVFKLLDLGSFKSVVKFVEDIKATEERLDILVNNAGIGSAGKRKSEDGLLLQMQINYFGPFLLTNLLLDLIKKTPKSRIVNVSSTAAKYAKNVDVNNLNSYPDKLRIPDVDIYFRSKLCNILFTIELANRLKGSDVTTYSLHPGVVNTDIFRKMPAFPRQVLCHLLNWFCKSPLEGAQTTIHCSVAKGIESLSGEHFEDCRVVSRYSTAEDQTLCKKLWKISVGLVKF